MGRSGIPLDMPCEQECFGKAKKNSSGEHHLRTTVHCSSDFDIAHKHAHASVLLDDKVFYSLIVEVSMKPVKFEHDDSEQYLCIPSNTLITACLVQAGTIFNKQCTCTV